MKDIIFEQTFVPYLDGPQFHLTMWDTHIKPEHARCCSETFLGYMLTKDSEVLFTGEDYRCSPLEAIDSKASVVGLMGFLTLKPGDTDSEYFEDYTQAQLEFCDTDAEALYCAVEDWANGQ